MPLIITSQDLHEYIRDEFALKFVADVRLKLSLLPRYEDVYSLDEPVPDIFRAEFWMASAP